MSNCAQLLGCIKGLGFLDLCCAILRYLGVVFARKYSVDSTTALLAALRTEQSRGDEDNEVQVQVQVQQRFVLSVICQ